jgi:hypothetical protein
MSLAGVLRLCCGAKALLRGRVVRVDGGEVALSLVRGFSYSTMVSEQRALRAQQRYPARG